MKQGIHPEYREVLVHDLSNGYEFLTKSSQITSEKKEYNGKEYPLIKVEISSQSHPFFTGKEMLVDTAGRIDKFYKKYGKKPKK
jgi:large subunit ribosomal protein L31